MYKILNLPVKSHYCVLDLEDSIPILLHDTPAQNDTPPYQVWIQKVQLFRGYFLDKARQTNTRSDGHIYIEMECTSICPCLTEEATKTHVTACILSALDNYKWIPLKQSSNHFSDSKMQLQDLTVNFRNADTVHAC